MKPKVLIALNTAWNLHNFRAGLIRGLVAEGFDVVTVAPFDDYVVKLEGHGCRYVSLPMDNHGMHPGKDLLLFWRYLRLLKRERPSVFLGYTIKPNIYGSLAARIAGVPVINNITGLGRAFARENWLAAMVKRLYRIALASSHRVFFQNEENRLAFIRGGMVKADVTDRIPGSGIDLKRFQCRQSVEARLNRRAPFRFLLLSRMLWEKGVGVYADAARLVKAEGREAEFCLLGFMDGKGHEAISPAQMMRWEREGIIRYLGESDDVRLAIADADCVVLPSYYMEGVPRSLLEAAAMSRPIITTDTIGCREVVEDGVSGFLCRPNDEADLADRMLMMLALSPEERLAMGSAGRRMVEDRFDERIVINKYINEIRRSMGAKL